MWLALQIIACIWDFPLWLVAIRREFFLMLMIVRKRINSWNNSFLSKAGKEIMVNEFCRLFRIMPWVHSYFLLIFVQNLRRCWIRFGGGKPKSLERGIHLFSLSSFCRKKETNEFLAYSRGYKQQFSFNTLLGRVAYS